MYFFVYVYVYVYVFFFYKVVELVGGGYVINWAHPV